MKQATLKHALTTTVNNLKLIYIRLHLHLVARSRMSGAIPLLHLYAFMAWTRTTLPCCSPPYLYLLKVIYTAT